MADKNYVNFDGIDNRMVHERTRQDGSKFYSVGISPVPYTFSKSGVANVTTNYVNPSKDYEGKSRIGFPEDFKVKVSVCTFLDKNDSKNNKYDTVEMTAKELQAKQTEALEAINAAKEAKEAKEAEAENEGPEM